MLEINKSLGFDKINEVTYASEEDIANNLLKFLTPEYKKRINNIQDRASEIVNASRKYKGIENPINSLLQEYQLNTKEGTILLCLAESLLRIPDKKTIDRLLEDKFTSVDWKQHTGFDKGLFVNASSWAFFLTGNILDKKEVDKNRLEENLFQK